VLPTLRSAAIITKNRILLIIIIVILMIIDPGSHLALFVGALVTPPPDAIKLPNKEVTTT